MSLVSALHLITSAFLEAMRRRWYLDALLRAGIQAADDVEEEPPVEDEDNKTIFSDEGSNCSESVATIVPEQAELPREEQADTLQEQAELPREEQADTLQEQAYLHREASPAPALCSSEDACKGAELGPQEASSSSSAWQFILNGQACSSGKKWNSHFPEVATITWVGGEQISIRRVAWGSQRIVYEYPPGKVIKFARSLSDNEPDMKLSLWAPDLAPGVYGSWHGTCSFEGHMAFPLHAVVQDRFETAEEYLERRPPADVYFAEHVVAILARATLAGVRVMDVGFRNLGVRERGELEVVFIDAGHFTFDSSNTLYMPGKKRTKGAFASIKHYFGKDVADALMQLTQDQGHHAIRVLEALSERFLRRCET